MTKKPNYKLRMIGFPFAALVFFAVCFLIVMLAIGYKFKFENGKIISQQTGMILLSSHPGDANVYLDGSLLPDKTPIINFSLFPLSVKQVPLGEHTVKVEKDGYIPWEGIFNVEPNIVCWGNYIILIPIKREAAPFSFPGNVVQTITSHDKTHELVVVENPQTKIQSVWDVNTNSKEKKKIYEAKMVDGETNRIIGYANQKDRFLLENTKGDSRTQKVFETKENGASWNINDLFKISFDNLVFNPRNHNELYVLKDKKIYTIDYSNKNTSAVLASEVIGIYPEDQNLLFVQILSGNYGLWRLEQNNSKTNIVEKLTPSENYQIAYFSQIDSYAVLSTSDSILSLISSVDGKPTSKKIDEKVDGFLASPNAKYLGYIKEGSFISYETEKNRYFTAIKNGGISSISWFSDESNLIYVKDGKIRMVNFNGFYDNELFDASKDVFVTAAPNSNTIYFGNINKDKNNLDLYSFSL